MEILNNGFIKLIDMMGSDQRVLDAARVSTGSISKGESKDQGLINYLMENKHSTPFEKIVFEFHIRAPIFVARQWFRHRIGSFNEESARYKEFSFETYHPKEWRKQSEVNVQASSKEKFMQNEIITFDILLEDSYNKAKENYDKMIAGGVARELARLVMPVGVYTEFYWTVNFRSLMNFLTLRNSDHAQFEIKEFAKGIEEIISNKKDLKWSFNAFKKYGSL